MRDKGRGVKRGSLIRLVFRKKPPVIGDGRGHIQTERSRRWRPTLPQSERRGRHYLINNALLISPP